MNRSRRKRRTARKEWQGQALEADLFLGVVLEIRAFLEEAVELLRSSGKQSSNACVVSDHQARDSISGLNVWTLLGQRDLQTVMMVGREMDGSHGQERQQGIVRGRDPANKGESVSFIGGTNLNARRPPGNESREFVFPNPLQTFMNLCRINLTLNKSERDRVGQINGSELKGIGHRGSLVVTSKPKVEEKKRKTNCT